MQMPAPFLTWLSRLGGGISLCLLLCGSCMAQVLLNRMPVEEHVWTHFISELGFAPSRGSYWYDARSGAWGMEGERTAGFIAAGLAVSVPVPADASRGNTGIFINRRELTIEEAEQFAKAGIPIAKGRWWLDANGIGGVEGDGPLFNVFTLDQRERARRGLASIHDFWGKQAPLSTLAIAQRPSQSNESFVVADLEACAVHP